MSSNIGVDTPIPYRTSDLTGILEEYIGKLELRGELAPYKRLKARIETISRDPRYAFMFGSLTVQDTMAAGARRASSAFRSTASRSPFSNSAACRPKSSTSWSRCWPALPSISACGAPGAFRSPSSAKKPIATCRSTRSLGFEPTKRAISRIAKEGRKYGVSLCIVTQRPAELDPTILSQCNTIFSMRLTNERDQDILHAGISDAAASLLEFMSTMGTGEAITFGEGVALPTRIKFDMLPADAMPKSNTASFTTNWAKDLPDDTFLQRGRQPLAGPDLQSRQRRLLRLRPHRHLPSRSPFRRSRPSGAMPCSRRQPRKGPAFSRLPRALASTPRRRNCAAVPTTPRQAPPRSSPGCGPAGKPRQPDQAVPDVI